MKKETLIWIILDIVVIALWAVALIYSFVNAYVNYKYILGAGEVVGKVILYVELALFLFMVGHLTSLIIKEKRKTNVEINININDEK